MSTAPFSLIAHQFQKILESWDYFSFSYRPVLGCHLIIATRPLEVEIILRNREFMLFGISYACIYVIYTYIHQIKRGSVLFEEFYLLKNPTTVILLSEQWKLLPCIAQPSSILLPKLQSILAKENPPSLQNPFFHLLYYNDGSVDSTFSKNASTFTVYLKPTQHKTPGQSPLDLSFPTVPDQYACIHTS